jgi:IS1 family transposase
MQAQLDLQHVQVDEIRAKGRQMVPWMAMALMVTTRLWLGGVVSLRRDRHLADQVLQLVKTCCLPLRPVLVLTDGWSAYPGSIRRAFREKIKKTGGRGRCALQGWPEILMGTVIKKTAKKRVVEVIRRMTQGTLERANEMLVKTLGGKELNTAFIERFNGTMRERLASLTRRCRHAARRVSRLEAGMWLVGCTYNFCWPHHELSRRATHAQDRRGEVLLTPAMASGLTNPYLERSRGSDLSRCSATLEGTNTARSAKESGRACLLAFSHSITPVASSAKGGFMLVHQLRESYHRYCCKCN